MCPFPPSLCAIKRPRFINNDYDAWEDDFECCESYFNAATPTDDASASDTPPLTGWKKEKHQVEAAGPNAHIAVRQLCITEVKTNTFNPKSILIK